MGFFVSCYKRATWVIVSVVGWTNGCQFPSNGKAYPKLIRAEESILCNFFLLILKIQFFRKRLHQIKKIMLHGNLFSRHNCHQKLYIPVIHTFEGASCTTAISRDSEIPPTKKRSAVGKNREHSSLLQKNRTLILLDMNYSKVHN